MADNVSVPGVATIAADDIGGIEYQRVKVNYGTDGSATDVSDATPLPVSTKNGAYGYAAGTAAATVDVPAGARAKYVTVLAGSAAAATVAIGTGPTITVPAGTTFERQLAGDVALGADVIVGGTVSAYYVEWVVV